MRDEPPVSVDIARRAIRSTEHCQSDETMLPRSGSDSSLKRGIRCAPLRAARNYVRYSATLRSYSGFVDVTERAVRQVHGLSQFAGEVR